MPADPSLQPLGRRVVLLELGQYLALKDILPRSSPAAVKTAAFQAIFNEIKLSCLRYVLATLKALHGPEDTWKHRRPAIVAFARHLLPDLLRAYGLCVRTGFGAVQPAPSGAACCADQATAATCQHALSALRRAVGGLAGPLKPKDRETFHKVVLAATNEEARERYASVVRSLIELHL